MSTNDKARLAEHMALVHALTAKRQTLADYKRAHGKDHAGELDVVYQHSEADWSINEDKGRRFTR